MGSQISRREFLKSTVALTAGYAFGDLPEGSAPTPLTLGHFPDRLHAFVWRNWSLVPVDRMAGVIGAKAEEIVRLGRAMGLKGPPPISHEQIARSYITVIKRNWHLLPYAQLLDLLGWSAERLEFTLREDDFLFVKLGNLKPRCDMLRYRDPDPAALAREREIASIVHQYFPDHEERSVEPLFGFVARLSEPVDAVPRQDSGHLRFCYSYFALYGDPLLDEEFDPYPDGYLSQLAGAGVTGIWLQAILNRLAEFPWQKEISAEREKRLHNLRRLTSRAGKRGLRVFLYLNEPRSMPLGFFASRPELRGTVEGEHAALCTTVPQVRAYLHDAVAAVCRAVPDLGGFFTITASENFTNCWSHGNGAKCPRCGVRAAPDVIAEVNNTFAEGIRSSGSSARLIVWDWGWRDEWAGQAIRQLTPESSLMSVSEWRLPIHRGGVKSEVGEYSISAVGPGPRAQEHWRMARERGLRTVAKVQAGNTWELSAVPYVPAVENVARHAENLSGLQVSDFMLGWTLGGYPSPNLEAFSETLACGSAAEAMRRVAERRFGAGLAPGVVTAWHDISKAFSEFPYHAGVVYSGPQQLGPANLLWRKPTGYRATMVGFAYDDLDSWRSVYPPEVFIQQLEKVAAGFDAAVDELKEIAKRSRDAVTDARREALQSECRITDAASIHFRSSANQGRFVLARRALDAARSPAERLRHVQVLKGILKSEINLAQRLYHLQRADSRIGFEASNHYFYVPLDLIEKVLNCRGMLRTLA